MLNKLRSLSKILAAFSIGSISIYAATDKSSEQSKQHYSFLTPHELQKCVKKYPNLTLIDSIFTEHIISIMRNKETDIIVN